jgi:phosphatidate cytidylyltransferase
VSSPLAARVATAIIAVPALVWVIGWGGPRLFSWLVLVAVVVSFWEFYRMVFSSARERIGPILVGLIVAVGVIQDHPELMLAIAVCLLLLGSAFGAGPLIDRFNRVGWVAIGTLYIGFLLPHTALVYRLPDGPQWIFFTLVVVMIGDTAAYVVGKAIGKTKLYPEVSPNKTVEGAVASTVASLVTGLLVALYLLPAYPWFVIAGVAFLMSLLGQAGDLFESWIKRVFDVKDSGSILPGHGGLLDRLDSLIFPLVFIAYYARFFPQ